MISANLKRNSIMTDVGIWEPTFALVVDDSLFPHISHGFRNRTLPVVTYHVKTSLYM